MFSVIRVLVFLCIGCFYSFQALSSEDNPDRSFEITGLGLDSEKNIYKRKLTLSLSLGSIGYTLS